MVEVAKRYADGAIQLDDLYPTKHIVAAEMSKSIASPTTAATTTSTVPPTAAVPPPPAAAVTKRRVTVKSTPGQEQGQARGSAETLPPEFDIGFEWLMGSAGHEQTTKHAYKLEANLASLSDLAFQFSGVWGLCRKGHARAEDKGSN